MAMQVTALAWPEVLLLQPTVHRDARGFFVQSFHAQEVQQAIGQHVEFVQDNHSRSSQGVLRGLHYQLPPHGQGKLVQVLRGAVWDVVVDVRRTSPTFGQWLGVHLHEDSHQWLWVPAGFAHGFVVMSETADVLYKTTAYYAPAAERGVAWNDPDIGIQWPDLGMDFLLSDKDQKQPRLRDAEVFAS